MQKREHGLLCTPYKRNYRNCATSVFTITQYQHSTGIVITAYSGVARPVIDAQVRGPRLVES